MDLSNQLTINVQFSSVIIAISSILIISTGLIYYIVRLNRRVNVLSPKFGFGGKNVITVVIIAFLSIIAPLGTLLSSRNTEVRMHAGDLNSIIFNAQILEERDDEVVVGFSAVPVENGVVWLGDNYSAVWEVTGPSDFTFLEQELSSENPSYVLRVLSRGEYDIRLFLTGVDYEVEIFEHLSL